MLAKADVETVPAVVVQAAEVGWEVEAAVGAEMAAAEMAQARTVECAVVVAVAEGFPSVQLVALKAMDS